MILVITTVLAGEFMRFWVNFYFNYFQGLETSVIGFSFVCTSCERNVNEF